MKAGRMRYQLTLKQPTEVTNTFGEREVTYTDTVTVHAERVKHTGYGSDEVGEHFSDYKVSFNIRDAHTVEENWRVQQLGGYLYTVVAIEPNLDRGYKTLICVRVNE